MGNFNSRFSLENLLQIGKKIWEIRLIKIKKHNISTFKSRLIFRWHEFFLAFQNGGKNEMSSSAGSVWSKRRINFDKKFLLENIAKYSFALLKRGIGVFLSCILQTILRRYHIIHIRWRGCCESSNEITFLPEDVFSRVQEVLKNEGDCQSCINIASLFELCEACIWFGKVLVGCARKH